ncbi:MAG TPA: SusC/RagA family TonB-linked outer membrane protein [Gemmatimonadaceae bacterium]|nr:SusC/RagA family TonB-linked outer membrane protein [Gemmatimonadaceae bacterium]
MPEGKFRRAARVMMLPLLLPLLVAASAAGAAAQGGTISGTIIDAATNQPLVAAQVFITGTTLGSTTGADGKYSISGVQPGTVEVNVRRIGYASTTRQVQVAEGQTATADFALNSAAVSLSEIVVTATGEQRKREIGNAVSTIDAAQQAELKAPTNVATLIQGNATGVDITSASGTVGNAVNIKIRGNTSINLDNTPIVYVDGARINTDARSRGVGGAMSDRMLDIDPDNIASIEIVKGPAAATLYGTEAAAGVIRITTKNGGTGNTGAQFSAHGEYGMAWDPNEYPVRAWNPFVDIGPTYKDTTYYINSLKGSVDMPDEGLYYDPFRNGPLGKVGLSLRGGSEALKYYTSFEFRDQKGVFQTNSQRAYSARGNFTLKPRENVTIAVSNGYTTSSTAYNYNDGESWGYIGAVMLGQPMWAPIRAVDPNNGGASMVTCPRALEEARISGADLADVTASTCDYDRTFVGNNNFARLETMDNQVKLERYTGSATVTHTEGSVWTNRFTIGYDAYSEYGWDMIPNVPLKVLDNDPERTVTDVQNRTLTLEGTTALNFALPGNWNSQTTLGGQYYTTVLREAIATGFRFPPGAPTVGNGAATEAGEQFNEVRTIGFFVQQQFSYADRLFITPAVRFDRNSAFGSNLGSVAYPKIAASWVISDAPWFPQLPVDELRLRGAWGTSGKQPGSFDATTLLQVTSVTLPDGSAASGFSTLRQGNPRLKPERGQELELGFDASLFEHRLGLEFTYFDKLTKDALVERPLPPSNGFTSVWDNVGGVKNNGFEAAIDATLINRESLRWTTRLSATHVNSKITKLAAPIAVGGRGLQEHREGYAYGAYFMNPVSLDSNGDIVIGPEAIYVGQPTPTYTGTLSSTLTLLNGHLTLYGQLAASGGNKQVNYTEVYQCRQAFGTCAAKYERGPDGQPTREAILKSDPDANFQPYMFIYDDSYVKLRSLSAQYALPSSWASRVGASGASVSITGTNLGTWTDYPGTDPEINSQGRQNASQRDFFSAGQTRSVVFGLSLNY